MFKVLPDQRVQLAPLELRERPVRQDLRVLWVPLATPENRAFKA
jgi:hypothetical protein